MSEKITLMVVKHLIVRGVCARWWTLCNENRHLPFNGARKPIQRKTVSSGALPYAAPHMPLYGPYRKEILGCGCGL
tara:strand:- start:2413 stop:2640 length:228 start_codon:yes stop_codon:yes gene_type:complete